MIAGLTASAHAFCGVYVGGAGADLYHNATVVVMMRDGSRTVLSMQNNNTGPTEDFAMVVPVPDVLDKDDVKPLPREIFAKTDTLAATRLVAYWEHTPCEPWGDKVLKSTSVRRSGVRLSREGKPKRDRGFTVEAAFAVAEYDLLILSAKDLGGFDIWL